MWCGRASLCVVVVCDVVLVCVVVYVCLPVCVCFSVLKIVSMDNLQIL